MGKVTQLELKKAMMASSESEPKLVDVSKNLKLGDPLRYRSNLWIDSMSLSVRSDIH